MMWIKIQKKEDEDFWNWGEQDNMTFIQLVFFFPNQRAVMSFKDDRDQEIVE